MSTMTDTTHSATTPPWKRNGESSQTRAVLEPPPSQALDVQRSLLALVAARKSDFSAKTGPHGILKQALSRVVGSQF
jgi:hypothetical protein